MFQHKYPGLASSRRNFLKAMGLAPLAFRPSPFSTFFAGARPGSGLPGAELDLSFRLRPVYPARSPLEDVLRRVAPGSDEFITEKYASEIEALLDKWSRDLVAQPGRTSALGEFLDAAVQGAQLSQPRETVLRPGPAIRTVRRTYGGDMVSGREQFVAQIQAWLGKASAIEVAEFQITGLKVTSTAPLVVGTDIRYDLVVLHRDKQREERVGYWRVEWSQQAGAGWKANRWETGEEKAAAGNGSGFIDVTAAALGKIPSYREQLLRGADDWRSVLDGACGIDVYGNNGIAAGDFDNDGFDDLYICQPAGLPNRLYRNRGDGTFEDVTESSGVGVLDGTACALFADFENKGVQDLLVVCGSGPLLFLNDGKGRFSLKRDAFKFAQPPQGTFTHAAIADYDRDGRLDVYFCLYNYYLGLDQYHYPVPYYDARNGPPNFLFHNEGNATFSDQTQASGLNASNDRYSFACAWGNSESSSLPDLYVANDFGRSNLYRNNGNGTFTDISAEAQVDDAGAGMSASWADCDNGGRADIYAANMWSAAGQRVSEQNIFHEGTSEKIRGLYQRHARGNSLYRNRGDGKFENISGRAGVDMGRWSWCSDFWDFDLDGYPDLYVANGYISGPERNDLSSFFWRQVVGKSPEDATPSMAYEHGWNALNELIRSDSTWSGYERNVMFANNRDGTFSEVSGVAGLDLLEDSRSFALSDIDHDGRLELIVKNRNAPQVRVLRNEFTGLGQAVVFRLRGTKSNRDAVGTAVTLEAGALRQTRYLQAGSGFLAQHSKELSFGVGDHEGPVHAVVRWPSGIKQEFKNLPINCRIEIQEGASEFTVKPFAAGPAVYRNPPASLPLEPLGAEIETWLIEPMKAPEFSLPDLAGDQHTLQSLLAGPVLLYFWASEAASSVDGLIELQRHRAAISASKLRAVAINVDTAERAAAARSLAAQQKLSFPVLFATPEVAGVYNIVYRYLYDRRRDLPIPTSFLLDASGMVIKVYQGRVDPGKVVEDLRSAPTTAAERMRKAIPFEGVLYQDAFQRNDFTYGVAMFQHGYLEQAAASFEEVIKAKPDVAEAYYNLGTLNLRRNQLEEAREYLEQALKLRANYPEAWNNLAMIAAQENRPEQAIDYFGRALALRPNYAVALENLGNFYRRQRQFDKAQELLTRALQIQPDDPESLYSLGMLYAQQDEGELASQYLDRALELRPDYPEALNNLGVLLVRKQDYDGAEQRFESCIRLAPSFDQSYLNLARLYASRGDRAKARDVLLDLLRIQPQNSRALQGLEVLK